MFMTIILRNLIADKDKYPSFSATPLLKMHTC
jgi:hypothetical protein